MHNVGNYYFPMRAHGLCVSSWLAPFLLSNSSSRIFLLWLCPMLLRSDVGIRYGYGNRGQILHYINFRIQGYGYGCCNMVNNCISRCIKFINWLIKVVELELTKFNSLIAKHFYTLYNYIWHKPKKSSQIPNHSILLACRCSQSTQS